MRKLLKTFAKSFCILLLIGIFYLNLSLYSSSDFVYTQQGTYNEDVYHQLQFLKSELHNGAGHKMQKIFPEGFIFINCLYGLSWVNLIEDLNHSSEIYEEGIQEISWTINEVHSPKGQAIFTKYLPLEYGAFYKGWSNFLLGKKLAIQLEEERNNAEVDLFFNNCMQISNALKNSESPYLESYRGATWPADGIIAVSSLALHDKIFGSNFKKDLTIWLEKVKKNLDDETGLIPHSIYQKTGKTKEGARGCSQSLILNFLIEINPEFARQQFEIFKEKFPDKRFALPGIREYPKGTVGFGDIDSGPVILGIGGAASIVGQRTMGLYGDWTQYIGLKNCIEAFGLGYTWNSKKRYILGILPMADAFIAWSNSIEKPEDSDKAKSNWRINFHILSLVLFLIIGFIYKRLIR